MARLVGKRQPEWVESGRLSRREKILKIVARYVAKDRWATIASLIETCKLNAVDPQAYLTSTLTAIVNGHKQSRIDELLPWNHRAYKVSAINDC